MLADSLPALKRRRFAIADPMEAQVATEKLAAAKQNYGREIHVFETTTATISRTSNDASDGEEPDDQLEFTTEDYYRVLSTKKEDKYLKTKKIRDAEAAASRSRITKAVVRVRFPDNHTLEATFHPSETMQSLVDLLVKVMARPDLPFYIYTVPPKKQIKDMSQDFYSAGFAPGAIVYFSYDLPQVDDNIGAAGPFLKEDVMSLKGLELILEQKPEPDHSAPEPSVAAAPAARKSAAEKKMVKPKWLKM
ncbi:plant UBX domain-containing protein 1-like [Cynara cardunculus var. scolymus]|uniref:plant UBX domain-containing protein 1-like n=1 Tax=Cynara cardunculus var. scolymus TaxID=59895 RepID=UPI000D62E2B0|nr:plant UBX domain-containing protein 1-like [Cynara cardunculus var. scolymus]